MLTMRIANKATEQSTFNRVLGVDGLNAKIYNISTSVLDVYFPLRIYSSRWPRSDCSFIEDITVKTLTTTYDMSLALVFDTAIIYAPF